MWVTGGCRRSSSRGHSISQRKGRISATYIFAVDIFEERQLRLKDVNSRYRYVFAPRDVECSQAATVLHQEEQRPARGLEGRGGGAKGQQFHPSSLGLQTYGAARHSPVSDVIAAGEVEVLQPVQVRRGLCHAAVTDARAVAESQAGEAAAVPSHRGQAGVGDLRQHGERQAAKVRVTHHLERERERSDTLSPCCSTRRRIR